MAIDQEQFQEIISSLVRKLIGFDRELSAFLHSKLNDITLHINNFILFLRILERSDLYFRSSDKIKRKFENVEDLKPHLERQLNLIRGLRGEGKNMLLSKYFLRIIHSLEEIKMKNYEKTLKKDEVRDIYILTRYDSELKDIMEHFEDISREILKQFSRTSITGVLDFKARLDAAEADREKALEMLKEMIEALEETRKMVYELFEITKSKIQRLENP